MDNSAPFCNHDVICSVCPTTFSLRSFLRMRIFISHQKNKTTGDHKSLVTALCVSEVAESKRAMPPRRRNARPVPAAPEPPPEDTAAAREGYDYQLAEMSSTNLQTSLQAECPICQLLLREPHQLECCGKLICFPCLEKTLAKGHKSCSLCRNPELNTFRDKNHRRVVEGLRVYCPHRPKEGEHSGCEWVGELGEVEKHLNCTLSRGNRTEGCQYVLLKCKYCKEDVVRSSLEEHESSLCSKPIVKCPFCDYFGEYTDVNGPHKKRCPNFPVACQQCKGMVGKKHIKLHKSDECPMTTIACELEEYGCSKTFPRKEMAAHMEKNHAVHLKMVMKVAEQRHKEELAMLSSTVVSLNAENHEINDTLMRCMHRSISLSRALHQEEERNSRALHQEEERNSRALHQEEERNEELVLALVNTRRELMKEREITTLTIAIIISLIITLCVWSTIAMIDCLMIICSIASCVWSTYD